MKWNEKLQIVIDYVENHLQRTEEAIDAKEIAEIADCSFSFFQKVFSYMNGISFAEYIRFRKLTLAGYDLKSTKMKVVDISYKYGYDSPTSFTKAFVHFHGISPKEARNTNVELRVYPKMQIFSDQQYTFKLEQKGTLRLIGKSIKMPDNDESCRTKILEFWSECQKNGVFARLISMDHGNPRGLFGVCVTNPDQTGETEYAIMVLSNEELPQEFTEIIIPAVTWAVFDCRGAIPRAIQDGWKYLNEEWLIKYPFQHAICPELEWYSDGNSFDKNYLSQIWIPIIEEEA